MAGFEVSCNEQAFDSNGSHFSIKLSAAENNALSMVAGAIHVDPGTDGVDQQNLPGNGIVGTYNQPVSVLQCNTTVSRRVATEGCVYMPDVIDNILSHI